MSHAWFGKFLGRLAAPFAASAAADVSSAASSVTRALDAPAPNVADTSSGPGPGAPWPDPTWQPAEARFELKQCEWHALPTEVQGDLLRLLQLLWPADAPTEGFPRVVQTDAQTWMAEQTVAAAVGGGGGAAVAATFRNPHRLQLADALRSCRLVDVLWQHAPSSALQIWFSIGDAAPGAASTSTTTPSEEHQRVGRALPVCAKHALALADVCAGRILARCSATHVSWRALSILSPQQLETVVKLLPLTGSDGDEIVHHQQQQLGVRVGVHAPASCHGCRAQARGSDPVEWLNRASSLLVHGVCDGDDDNDDGEAGGESIRPVPAAAAGAALKKLTAVPVPDGEPDARPAPMAVDSTATAAPPPPPLASAAAAGKRDYDAAFGQTGCDATSAVAASGGSEPPRRRKRARLQDSTPTPPPVTPSATAPAAAVPEPATTLASILADL